MFWTKKYTQIQIRDIIILAALGFLMTWSGLTCRDCIDSSRTFWVIGSFTSLIWIFLWKGNEYLGNFITSWISWIEFPLRRFVVGVITTLAFTLAMVYGLGYLYEVAFQIYLTQGAMYSVIITIIITLFMHGRQFLINLKKATIDAEKLKRENIAARYESLKNQVNPHFLFNSFNALSNLVYEDPDKAVKFIKQLSEVYRYVLDTREKEVVSLSEETDFLKSYLYLQQIRFGDKLKIQIDLNGEEGFIAPLALQMLIENAIKHNVVSEDDPLLIHVHLENEFIVVKNNLQKKMISAEPSAGVGLENICKRYEFLSDKKVEILKDAESFIVKLPVLSETKL
jgi:hypothetical protein